jgi:hypothetical protein
MERYYSIYPGVRELWQAETKSYGHRKGTARNTAAFASLLPQYLHFRLSLWEVRASNWHLCKRLHYISIYPILAHWISYSAGQHQERDNSASGLPMYNDRHHCQYPLWYYFV